MTQQIKGFEIIKSLYSNQYYDLILANEQEQNRRVILKIPNTSESIEKSRFYKLFAREIKIFQDINDLNIVLPCQLQSDIQSDYMKYDLGNKVLLTEMTVAEDKKIPFAFKYLRKITLQLQKIHNIGICHNNLTPYNIAIDPETEDVYFINITPQNSDLLSDYKYISPELTNRIKRPKTILSDFYSLGVIFYEILFKHPVDTESIKSLRRAHLTMNFPPLHKQDPSIPVFLSRIINRLLHKLPSMRYKNCYSLEHDLEMIEKAYIAGDETHFTLGEYNHISEIEFELPDVHYKKSLDEIMFSIQNEAQQRVMICNIVGRINQGHDIFINKLMEQCSKRVITHFSVTINSIAKELPFHTISLLLKKIVYNIKYSRDIETRDKLVQYLAKSNPRILSTLYHLCPDFNIIYDFKDRLFKIDVLNDHRTIYASIKSFVNFVLSLTKPMVLHFSHIENADSDTLKLFILLCNEEEISNLVFIFSTTQSHKQLKQLGNTLIESYFIPDINEEYANRHIAKTLKTTNDHTQHIATEFIARSAGNIFLYTRMINAAYNQQALFFNTDTKKWDIDFDNLKLINLKPDYNSYLQEIYDDLSEVQQKMLRYASLMGYMFDGRTLSLVTNIDMAVITSELWEIVNKCLIKTVTQFSRLKNTENITIYTFCNLEIRNFILNKTTEDEKKLLINIFKGLLDVCEKEPFHFILFEEFLHTNRTLIIELDEQHIYTLLSFYCTKAKTFVSLRKLIEAEKNINYCFSLLKPIAWLDKYYLTKEIYYIGLTIAFQTHNFEQFERLAHDASIQLLTVEDKLIFNELQIEYYLEYKKYDRAATVIDKSLTIIDFDIPYKLGLGYNIKSGLTSLLFKNKLFNNEMPEPRNRQKQYEDYICKLNTYSLEANPKAYRVTLDYIMYYSLKYGIKDYYTIPLLQYSKHLIEDNVNKSMGFKLALTVFNTKHKNPETILNKKLYYYIHIHPYISKIDKSRDFLTSTINYFLEYGNYKKAIYSCFHLMIQSILAGNNLKNVLRDTDKQIEKLIHHSRSNSYFKLLKSFKRFCATLISYKQDLNISPPDFEIEQNTFISYWYNIGLMLYFYYTDNFDKALICVENALAYAPSIKKNFSYFFLILYHSIIKLELAYRKGDFIIDDRELRKNIRLFKTMAQDSPEVFAHKYALLKALYYRQQGKDSKMLTALSKSVALSAKYGYKNIEAVSNRYIAQYYKEHNNKELFELHLIRAYNNYKSWGNNAVAQKLKLENYHVFEEMEIRIYKIN